MNSPDRALFLFILAVAAATFVIGLGVGYNIGRGDGLKAAYIEVQDIAKDAPDTVTIPGTRPYGARPTGRGK